MARLRTCQPRIWTIRWTVFLFMPSSRSGSQKKLRLGIPNHPHSLLHLRQLRHLRQIAANAVPARVSAVAAVLRQLRHLRQIAANAVPARVSAVAAVLRQLRHLRQIAANAVPARVSAVAAVLRQLRHLRQIAANAVPARVSAVAAVLRQLRHLRQIAANAVPARVSAVAAVLRQLRHLRQIAANAINGGRTRTIFDRCGLVQLNQVAGLEAEDVLATPGGTARKAIAGAVELGAPARPEAGYQPETADGVSVA